MKRKILLILAMCLICLCFVGCEHEHDTVTVYNKSDWTFDNIVIKTPSGYFYESYEKFKVDEDKVGVTIYFSIEEDSGWDYKEEDKLDND